ncbi:MAG: DUF188 domain-containing protein, partial [Oscillospiraceae bacterium]
VNMLAKNDIVITQDYGLAAMCLARGAKALSQNGMEYTNINIDSLLLSRHTNKKLRTSGKYGKEKNKSIKLKNNPKRTEQQDKDFFDKLTQMLNVI